VTLVALALVIGSSWAVGDDDIAWMNQHLDPARHRVGTTFKVIGYLTIP